MEKDLKISVKDRCVTVRLAEDIDHHAAGRMRGRIDEIITETLPRCVVLDFSSVAFMDSSGVGLIIGRAALCEGIGADVRVVGARRAVRRIIALSGIERISNVFVEDRLETEELLK